MLNTEQKEFLLAIARDSIRNQLDDSGEAHLDELIRTGVGSEILEENGVFVTLKYAVMPANGQDLHGCIGNIIGRDHLYESVRKLAVESAFGDPRFAPLASIDELNGLIIEISVLSVPRAVDSYREIEIGKDGVLLRNGFRSAVFLPQVAVEQGWNLEETLSHLSMKAGLGPEAWKEPDCHFQVFQAEVFSERD